jgi:hypothetical protein
MGVARSNLLVFGEVLTAMSMKLAVFWDAALCSLVDIVLCFKELTASVIALMISTRLYGARSHKTTILFLVFVYLL